MTTAIGGRIRCEISQNAMSLLPERPPEPPADRLAEDQEDREAPMRAPRATAAPKAVATKHEHDAADEQPDDADPRPVAEADQRVGRGRTEEQRDDWRS